MNAIALFAGAGGFSEGFRRAGYRVLAANEIDESIARTYKLRHDMSDEQLFCKDIKDLTISEIASSLGSRSADVIIGGPPCQGFSMAGARIRGNSVLDDPRNYLFKEYYRILKAISPNYFVMENVPGLRNFKNGQIINEIKRAFNNAGYYLDMKVLNAADFGIPQARRRLFIIGSKKGRINLRREIRKYKTSPVSVREAISDLNFLEAGEGSKEQDYIMKPQSNYQKERRKRSTRLFNHKATNHSKETIDRIKMIEEGENWRKLEENSYEINSNHSGAYGRLKWDSPAVTVTTRFDTPPGGRFIHPEKNRTITAREAARLQSFDDDYKFVGTKSSIKRQIGNAVPPLMAEVIAEIIKNHSN